ncbi:MAG: thiamine phosphate synthase, partial [Candidatus Methanomethylophilaceae archaeon]
ERKGKDDSILTGASVHSIQDAKDAEELGADWLVFGNVFETSCKVGKAGAGTDMLKEVCESTSLPVYAIGGVTADNIRSVMRSGASGACIMSGLMMAERPSEVIDRLRRNSNLQSKISIL